MFLSLNSGRTYAMGGPNPISWTDMKAWDDLLQVGLTDWEVRAIKALDSLWLRVMSEGKQHE